MEVSTLRSSKAQVFLPDFVSSVAIFSFILVFSMIIWNSLVVNNFSGNREDLVLNAERSQTLLLETSGYPSDWNGSNVVVPGLLSSGHISPQKVLYLKRMNDKARNKLLKNAYHNFTLKNENRLATFNGSKLTFGYQINNSEDLITLHETVSVNKSGEIVLMEAVYSEWK